MINDQSNLVHFPKSSPYIDYMKESYTIKLLSKICFKDLGIKKTQLESVILELSVKEIFLSMVISLSNLVLVEQIPNDSTHKQNVLETRCSI